MTHKNRKKKKKFHVLKCWMFSFEGRRLLLLLGCPLFRLRDKYGKIAIFDLKKNSFLPAVYFFTFLVIKTLDPDLYPDPYPD
jgi:hypothetical protein